MPQQVRRRKETVVQFSTNNKISEDLGRGVIYRELYLNLSCTPTLTAGNNVYANILRGDEWACVKKVEILANNTDVLFSMSGADLRMWNYFMFGKMPRVSTALGAGGANPVCNSTLTIPFWMPRSVKPFDTALDASQLSSLTVDITWGTYTDIAATASAWTTEPSMNVYSLVSSGIVGSFSKTNVFKIEDTITATNPQFKVRLPVNPAYRGVVLNTTDAGVDVGTIINNLKVVSGSTVFLDYSEEILDHLKDRMNLQRSYSGTAYDDLQQGDANSIDGWYWVDFLSDGRLSECIDTLGFSQFELEIDVTVGAGTTKLSTIPYQLYPLRNAPKA